jgi:phage-related protein
METSTLAEDDNSLSPPSVGTTQTELTDERTEIQSTLANMQDTFAKQIKSIKDANEAKVCHAEERIQQAEQTYIAAQQAILHEFNTLTQNYSNVRESFANLSSDVRKAQVVQDKRHLGMKQTIGTMMQILVGVHQNLANGTNPQPLTQEQVDQIMQNAYEENERDGAPGTNVITESSSTTQQESGRKS